VVDGFLGGAQPDEGEIVGRAWRLRELGCKALQLREEAFANTAGACRLLVWAVLVSEILTNNGNEDLTRKRHDFD
jgi:hypothetical protein